VQQRRARGIVAGLVLARLINRRESRPAEATLGRMKQEVSKAVSPKWGDGYSPKTIDNVIWPAFAPVAHLWASWLLCKEKGSAPIPCEASVAPKFLAIAEAYRSAGEAFRAKKATTPVLDPSATWRVPAVLAAGLPLAGFAGRIRSQPTRE
jgi:hypothetical protein